MMEECMEIRENNDNNHENNVENSNNNDNNNIIINNNINDNIIINNNNSMEFPEGMRVLAVDDNSVCLKILTRLLDVCRYQVTSSRNKTEALELLKQNVDNFDIVLTNVNIDEMDGFKLLEAGLELDIPVIMISASESKSIIMKGVRHGAVDYLIKPVRFEAVKTIWQHVYRKTLISSPMTGGQVDETQVDLVGTSEREEDAGHVQVDEDTNSRRVGKRKCPTDDDSEGIDVPPTKRERIKWTTELHKKFLEAVEFLGGVDKAVPKKILEYMNVPGLSREKVASHLQKFRKSIQKIREGSLKQENQNNNARGYLFNSPSMGSTSVATTLMSRGHRSIIGNHNLSRGSLLGPNCINQPNNNNSLRIGSSIGGYTPLRTLLQPQCSMPNHQIIMQQPSTSMIMPAEGNILGSVSSTLLDLQTYPQLPLDNPFDSRIIQAPDEMFDPSPSMIDSTYEPPPLNNIFDIGEYPSLYEFAEDDKPKF